MPRATRRELTDSLSYQCKPWGAAVLETPGGVEEGIVEDIHLLFEQAAHDDALSRTEVNRQSLGSHAVNQLLQKP